MYLRLQLRPAFSVLIKWCSRLEWDDGLDDARPSLCHPWCGRGNELCGNHEVSMCSFQDVSGFLKMYWQTRQIHGILGHRI
jgi:hypothetical protein